jgi:hypothetical protein
MTNTPDSSPTTVSKVDVFLRGDHPHSGKAGWIPMRNGEPETINMLGRLMVKIEFPDGTGCYAEQRHLARID